eukprot:6969067-Pyramimonas_sp.AAC.2
MANSRGYTNPSPLGAPPGAVSGGAGRLGLSCRPPRRSPLHGIPVQYQWSAQRNLETTITFNKN